MRNQDAGNCWTRFSLKHVLGIILVGSLGVILGTCSTPRDLKRSVALASSAYFDITHSSTGGPYAFLPRSESSRRFSSSTDYFRWVVGAHIVKNGVRSFVAPGRDSKSLEAGALQQEENIWCIVVDVDESTPASTPVFFTSNLQIRSLTDSTEGALSEKRLMGHRGVLVVRKNGQFDLIERGDLARRFNPDGATNAVLRP